MPDEIVPIINKRREVKEKDALNHQPNNQEGQSFLKCKLQPGIKDLKNNKSSVPVKFIRKFLHVETRKESERTQILIKKCESHEARPLFG